MEEEIMNAQLTASAETLRQTAERMARAGLIIDRECLSPEQRRAVFALQCLVVSTSEVPSPRRPLIGFAYPNAR
jgi:hypothetical protein